MSDQLIDPWRERFGNRDVLGGVEPMDLSRIFGPRVIRGIPYVPQRAMMYEAVSGAPALPPPTLPAPNLPIKTPREEVIELIDTFLRENFPDFPRSVILRTAPYKVEKYRFAKVARVACIRAVKAAYPNWSTTRIGSIFNLDHSSISRALSDERIEKHRKQCRERERAKAAKRRAA